MASSLIASTLPRISGRREGVDQIITIEPQVVQHIQKHRQLLKKDSEAGGQLFGTLSPDGLVISRAAGPYFGDERTRFSYRSNPKSAQRAINKAFKMGLLYLGEWHTHAEKIPDFSGLDLEAIKLVSKHSSLNVDSLVLIIAGNGLDFNWIRIWSLEGGRLIPWEINAAS